MYTGPRRDVITPLPTWRRVIGAFEHIARAAGQPLGAASDVLDFGADAGRVVGFRVLV